MKKVRMSTLSGLSLEQKIKRAIKSQLEITISSEGVKIHCHDGRLVLPKKAKVFLKRYEDVMPSRIIEARNIIRKSQEAFRGDIKGFGAHVSERFKHLGYESIAEFFLEAKQNGYKHNLL